MFIYLVVMAAVEDISLVKGIKRMKYVLIFVAVLGIVNPFFDRRVVIIAGNLHITGGVISMITLLLKGIFTVLATYILVLTAGIENICHAFRTLHVPQSVVTVLLLTYRYVIVLLKEVERMVNAYHICAPKQRGINIKAWGSFVGLLLIRSMDRAKTVYESMLLRGYSVNSKADRIKGSYSKGLNIVYGAVWLAVFAVLRFIPVFEFVGKIFW
jgi:cobalt/nickel transport system permease protein